MTGFGAAFFEAADFSLELVVKSLNSRFLEIKFYTPACYTHFEPQLKKLISEKCQRGYFTIRIERFPANPPQEFSLDWDKPQALKWKALYKRMAQEMKFANDLTVAALVQKEGVLNLRKKPFKLSLREEKRLKETFLQALRACLQERKREGALLKKDILSNMKSLQAHFRQIKLLNGRQKQAYMAKKNFLVQKSKKSTDLVMEMEKFDIHEEIVRMEGHFKHFKKITSSTSSPAGRKIDFYIQEILREMNTMGAKSVLPDLTLKVVEGKFILEKIREQSQNIE